MFSELVLLFLAFQTPPIFGAYPTYPAAGPASGRVARGASSAAEISRL